MERNTYEVFDEFKKQKNEKERIDCLRKYATPTFVTVLKLTFDPKIKFTTNVPPTYKKDKAPVGMSMSNMPMAIKKAYLWIAGYVGRPQLTKAKEELLLIQLLESLEEREAEVWMNMMNKDLKIPYLTEKLVTKAFPNLIAF